MNITAIATATSLELSWTTPVDGTYPVSGYNIYRTTFSGITVSTANLHTQVSNPAMNTFIDAEVTRGVTYCYRLGVLDSQGNESPTSNELCLIIPIPPLPPAPYVGPVRVFPNPFNPGKALGGTLKFEGDISGAVLRIYSMRGLRVIELGPIDSNKYEWNGLNQEGRRVAPGIYLWLLDNNGNKRRGKLVIER